MFDHLNLQIFKIFFVKSCKLCISQVKLFTKLFMQLN